ncbi:ABC transporter permease [Thermopolyspora flexuosa]|uniref:Carbohydrate ABC transporter membrane protein 1 (CUT1 family) n=1 Tax=Thermopolyspora flexuosa TaxID=103836 RepID=A0A543IWJ9_9ACTN|nr:sugar ABC transporter permease [Thermopolyspora flexuosa]TQM74950.1 carbohydrate ABC transporter membrane protein 1 (CUT1 family) [Thermopolyspora flexuosa]GGM80122.1 ABC transporter permease [Thermopolyspora flexuosa]
MDLASRIGTSAPTDEHTAGATRDPTPNRRRRSWAGYAFIAPFGTLFALVFIVPILYAAYLSLFQQRLLGGDTFVGLANYTKLLQDPQFWDGVGRVVWFTLIQVPIMLLFAMAVALALDSLRVHGAKFMRVTIFLPYAVPAIVSTLMWGFMLGVKYGLFGSLNRALGTSIDPFTPDTTLISIGVMVTWAFTGFNMLIFYSALKAVPRELYEAAAIDGANEFQIIRWIKLPALRGTLVVTIIFSIIGTFQMFNEPQILQSMVANSGITTHYTPNLYAYHLAFTGSQQGYAAALALVMAVITIAIAYAVQIRGLRNALDR